MDWQGEGRERRLPFVSNLLGQKKGTKEVLLLAIECMRLLDLDNKFVQVRFIY